MPPSVPGGREQSNCLCFRCHLVNFFYFFSNFGLLLDPDSDNHCQNIRYGYTVGKNVLRESRVSIWHFLPIIRTMMVSEFLFFSPQNMERGIFQDLYPTILSSNRNHSSRLLPALKIWQSYSERTTTSWLGPRKRDLVWDYLNTKNI